MHTSVVHVVLGVLFKKRSRLALHSTLLHAVYKVCSHQLHFVKTTAGCPNTLFHLHVYQQRLFEKQPYHYMHTSGVHVVVRCFSKHGLGCLSRLLHVFYEVRSHLLPSVRTTAGLSKHMLSPTSTPAKTFGKAALPIDAHECCAPGARGAFQNVV